MTFLHALLSSQAAMVTGLALFHSLWQGGIIALTLAAVLGIERSARARYAAACIAMLTLVASFLLTLAYLFPETRTAPAALIRSLAFLDAARSNGRVGSPQAFRPADLLPLLTLLWMVGVAFLQMRAFTGWLSARRFQLRGVCTVTETWAHRLRQLSQTLGVVNQVTLLESALTQTPILAGFIRPVILVPVGMLTAMPAQQIDAILLHELAHLRRNDYLANLAQTIVEGFFFYHPALWWISSVIRQERENCCDDIAAAALGNAHDYASALTALEHTLKSQSRFAVAAHGGNLVQRIRRLLFPSNRPGFAMPPVLSAAILLSLVSVFLMAWQQQPPPIQSVQTQWEMWLDNDVVYIIERGEREAFNRLTSDAERNMFIQQFWERRDPTPGTVENQMKEEHYRRIAYANERFSASLPGWKTDRGRIYIVYGPPDEIESHPSGSSLRPAPYEQWLYRKIQGVGTRVLVEFVDQSSTGDYRMKSEFPR